MNERRSVSARAAQAVAVFSLRYGLPAEELLGAAGIDAAEAADPDGRVAHSRILRLWCEAAARSGDPDFGLHMAEWLRPEEYHDVLGYVCRSAPTLGEAFRRAARYFALLHQEVTLRLEERGGEAHLVHHLPPEAGAGPRHMVECVLAALLLQGRRGLGREIRPLLVRFRHEAPAATAEHERIFGAPLRFSAPVSELVLPRALLEEPQREADPQLCAVLDRQAETQLARLPEGPGLLGRAEACVGGLLHEGGGEPSLEAVAGRLRMSPRSLQRHLHTEGTTFQALLQGVRHDLALQHLSERRLAISEIAFLLGFSDVSTFHRAFRRWTGRTPASYRRGP